MIRALIRDPLVHFVLGGALIFAFHVWRGGPVDRTTKRIVVDEAQIVMLADSFHRTWQRAPTNIELDHLIDEHVIAEVMYREALALGLDRADPVVRRRMQQKLDQLNSGQLGRDPNEAELQAHLAAHPERFADPPRIDFVQVFLDHEQDDESIEQRGEALLARLRAGESAGELGDPTLLPSGMKQATKSQIANALGDEFAGALMDLPPGAWHGPIRSIHGAHLVRVLAREPAPPVDLADVRAIVAREWAEEQGRQSRARFHALLLEDYEIEIRRPDASAERDAGLER